MSPYTQPGHTRGSRRKVLWVPETDASGHEKWLWHKVRDAVTYSYGVPGTW
jgi:hypothetical protein